MTRETIAADENGEAKRAESGSDKIRNWSPPDEVTLPDDIPLTEEDRTAIMDLHRRVKARWEETQKRIDPDRLMIRCREAVRAVLGACRVDGANLNSTTLDVNMFSQEVFLRIWVDREARSPEQAVWNTTKRVVIDILREAWPTARIDLDESLDLGDDGLRRLLEDIPGLVSEPSPVPRESGDRTILSAKAGPWVRAGGRH